MNTLNNKLITWSIFPYILTLGISLPIIVVASVIFGLWSDPDTLNGIIIESFGMIFDIIVLGIVFTIVNRIREKRLEEKRYLEEIDDYRGWFSQEASQRISGILRRLHNRNKSKGVNLYRCYLANSELRSINLQGANISWSNIENASLRDANLKNVDLQNTILNDADLTSASLNDVNLVGAKLHNTVLLDANLVRADLRHAQLNNADMTGCDLQNAKLEQAVLSCVQLEVSTLDDADFSGVQLDGASFYSLSTKSEESEASLDRTILSRADLTDAYIKLYQLKKVASLEGATMMDGTKYDASWAQKIEAS